MLGNIFFTCFHAFFSYLFSPPIIKYNLFQPYHNQLLNIFQNHNEQYSKIVYYFCVNFSNRKRNIHQSHGLRLKFRISLYQLKNAIFVSYMNRTCFLKCCTIISSLRIQKEQRKESTKNLRMEKKTFYLTPWTGAQ